MEIDRNQSLFLILPFEYKFANALILAMPSFRVKNGLSFGGSLVVFVALLLRAKGGELMGNWTNSSLCLNNTNMHNETCLNGGVALGENKTNCSCACPTGFTDRTCSTLPSNRTYHCKMEFVWNNSYNSAVDPEHLIGQYVCKGCNDGFVVKDGTVVTDIDGNPLLPPKHPVKRNTSINNITQNSYNNITQNASLNSFSAVERLLNGTYECVPCKIKEDYARTQYTLSNASNATIFSKSHYHFYEKKRNNSNVSLPFSCSTCDYVRLVKIPYNVTTSNKTGWARHENATKVSNAAVVLWGLEDLLRPVRLSNNSKGNCAGRNELQLNATNCTRTPEIYSVHEFNWNCATPNITNNTEHEEYWFHYLKACPACIAYQSSCESKNHFLYGQCMCDMGCGEENMYQLGRCVYAKGNYDTSNELLRNYYNTTFMQGLYYDNGKEKLVCKRCPPFTAFAGDFTFTSDCVVNTIVIRLFWSFLLISGYYIMRNGAKHVHKLYNGRGIWQGYYAAIHFEEGRLWANRYKTFYKLVWLHDEGYFVCLCLLRSLFLTPFVAIPKVVRGEGSEIGLYPLVTIFYALVASVDVYLVPELVLMTLTHAIRTGLPNNHYRLHLIKYLHEEMDFSYRLPRVVLVALSFMGPISLLLFTSSAYQAQTVIIPFTYQKVLVEVYHVYVRIHSLATISLFVGVTMLSLVRYHLKVRNFKKLVEADCYKERHKVETGRRRAMIEAAYTFEISLCMNVYVFVCLLGCWYFGLVFSNAMRVHIAYGIAPMSLGVDLLILYLFDKACFGYPRRLNSPVSRRYIKVGANLKGFQDNIELTQVGNINVFKELNKEIAAKGTEEPPAKLSWWCYLPCCAPCRPKEKIHVVSTALGGDTNAAATERAEKAFKAMGLGDKDVGQFYTLYRKMDKDNGGSIDIQEFYRYFRLQRSPFCDRVFQVMDGDGSKELDFVEFVVSLWNFCSLNKGGLILFAFTLYDVDDSGELEGNEMMLLIKEIYGQHAEVSSRVTKLLKQIDASGDGTVQIHEFIRACKRHGQILQPAHSVQEYLQQKSFGLKFWKDCIKKRQISSMGFSQDSLKAFLKDMDFLRRSEQEGAVRVPVAPSFAT